MITAQDQHRVGPVGISSGKDDEIILHRSHPSLMAAKGIILASDVASGGQLFTGAWATSIHASKQTQFNSVGHT